VSSGDLLRTHIAEGTELGRQASAFVDQGVLVPDDLVLEIVSDAVRVAMRSGGYVLDGFPRTLAQAERAHALAEPAGVTADAVLYLAVSDTVARARLDGREDDRLDDADPAAIERRLAAFRAETGPLLEFYKERGILLTIDASAPVDDVSAAIFGALRSRT
jgi:adenylate kinase